MTPPPPEAPQGREWVTINLDSVLKRLAEVGMDEERGLVRQIIDANIVPMTPRSARQGDAEGAGELAGETPGAESRAKDTR